jgi:hypothetical protein
MTPSVRECVLVLCSVYSKGGSALSGNPEAASNDVYIQYNSELPLLLLEQRGRELEELFHAAQLLYSQACFRHDS